MRIFLYIPLPFYYILLCHSYTLVLHPHAMGHPDLDHSTKTIANEALSPKSMMGSNYSSKYLNKSIHLYQYLDDISVL
jgi:hypothetical protein